MDEDTQITGICQLYEYYREEAVGLYRVIGKKRTIHVWAADDLEARRIAAFAGMRGTSAEPVLAGERDVGNGQRT
jgi:hypothetical protein